MADTMTELPGGGTAGPTTTATIDGIAAPTTKTVKMTPTQKAYRAEVVALAKKYGKEDPEKLFAITANVLGTLLPVQNAKKTSDQRIMAILNANLQLGRDATIGEIAKIEKLG